MVLILTLASAGAMTLALAHRKWLVAGLFAVFAALRPIKQAQRAIELWGAGVDHRLQVDGGEIDIALGGPLPFDIEPVEGVYGIRSVAFASPVQTLNGMREIAFSVLGGWQAGARDHSDCPAEAAGAGLLRMTGGRIGDCPHKLPWGAVTEVASYIDAARPARSTFHLWCWPNETSRNADGELCTMDLRHRSMAVRIRMMDVPRAEWAKVKEHATSVLDQSVVSVNAG